MSGNFGFISMPSMPGVDADIVIPQLWVGTYRWVSATADRTYTVSPALAGMYITIDIRNDPDATGNIVLVPGAGVDLRVSGDLGLIIPPGGVGELKRRGNSLVYDFYGYIE